MLTLYRPRRGEDSSEESDKDIIIPAGRTYFTKVNGKLVMAREKKPKVADIAIDLLGEAFGTRTVVRRRSRSVEAKPVPLLLTAGTPFNPTQVPALPYTAPIPQQSSFQTFVPYPHPPQGGSQPFIPYQPQPWNPSMITLSQMPPHTPHYTVPQTGSQPKPSKEDFEALKRIDAHFNEVTSKKTKRLSSGPAADEVTTKTTVTITKHICANCGRSRSNKYHMENPIKLGEEPTPAFCRKCQRHSNETSDSDDPKKPKSSQKQDIKKVKKNKEKSKSSSEDERSDSPDTKEQRKPKAKKQQIQSPMRDYIIVEEEFSEDERTLRGRQPKSKKKKNLEEQSPTLGYIVVEEEHSEDERVPRAKRHSLQIQESDVERRPQQRQCEQQRQLSGTEPFLTPHPMMASREGSFGSVSSQKSRRRRVERANPGTVAAAPWDAPHVIRPRSGDETIVVTERYVYKPNKQMEEQRREEERHIHSIKVSEKASKYYHDDWSQNQELPSHSVESDEEASRYYLDDWAREDPLHSPGFRKQRRQRTSVPGRYRQNFIQGSLADSEITEYYRAHDAVFHDLLPRAPSTPPSPPAEPWPEVPPFEDEETARRINTAKGKAPGREYAERRPRRRSDTSEVSSNYRTPSVREATDGGTEKALVLSPKRNHSRERSYDDYDRSDMTERERIVERETKRVTFRDVSPSSYSTDTWSRRSDASESFLKRKTSWDNSAVGPVPAGGEKW